MHSIKNIIFDLGGVFMNLNYQLTENAFIALGVHAFPTMFSQHKANPLFEQLETGKISEEEFYQAFRTFSGISLTDADIEKAWNAMLLDFPPERIQWLQNSNQKYNIFLLSNTNSIHYNGFIQILKKQQEDEKFNGYFKKAYYSHEMGLRKPYPEAFQYLINEQQLKVEETLFIDDTEINIQTAKALGLQTIHLKAPLTVLDLGL